MYFYFFVCFDCNKNLKQKNHFIIFKMLKIVSKGARVWTETSVSHVEPIPELELVSIIFTSNVMKWFQHLTWTFFKFECLAKMLFCEFQCNPRSMFVGSAGVPTYNPLISPGLNNFFFTFIMLKFKSNHWLINSQNW